MTQQSSTSPPRFWLVDSLRAIAIITMVYYHLMWDLDYFGVVQVDMLSGFWHYFAYSIASTFLFVMGVSLTISYNRVLAKTGNPHQFPRYFRRGLQIFGWGMLITVVTYFAFDEGYVVFGILHLIGTSVVIAYPFVRRKWLSLVVGLIFIAIGAAVKGIVIPEPWFLWAGVMQYGRYMVDYYPVFPWTGVALLGVFVGQVVYPGGEPIFTLPDISHWLPVRVMTFLGKHSLALYLLQQPILLTILFIMGIATLP